MIHGTLRMKMPARNVAEAMGILRSVAVRTRVQPGCISCRIYQDTQDKQVVMVEEFWKSQEELDRHLRSVEYRTVLLVVEMASEKPEIRFSEISHSTGVETIEKARNRSIC